jgi:hypothetical protein
MNYESPEDDPSVIETGSEWTTTSTYSGIEHLFVVSKVISYTLFIIIITLLLLGQSVEFFFPSVQGFPLSQAQSINYTFTELSKLILIFQIS